MERFLQNYPSESEKILDSSKREETREETREEVTSKGSTSTIGSFIQAKVTNSSGRSSTSSTHRQRIPDRPKVSGLSLWGFLKNCVGKDLSQLPLPINFSEPLSFLQKITEELEYAELLDKAASCSSPYEQIAYLAAFIVSGYSSSTRTTKPFNPLLGETFEFDRTKDYGYRLICEQVSHDPPVAVHYCEGKGWNLNLEFWFETKFTGNDIHVTPHGEANIEFSGGNSFKWNKVLTTVHNFMIGSLWIDHQGMVEIIGRDNAEGIKCNLEFIPYGGSSMKRIKSETRKVKGEVLNADGIQQWSIKANCDEQVEITAVVDHEETEEEEKPRLLWKCNILPEGSENYYSFSTFTCQLNEPEEGVAPTDSRLRPDQRFMEEGKWEEASNEKTRLEEKQRSTLKEKADNEDESTNAYKPIWFEPIQRDDGSLFHKYNGKYWECKEKQDWSNCPDIF